MMRQHQRLQIKDTALVDCGGSRQRSRSCSWNATGTWLASGSSDRFAKIYTVDTGSSQGRELQALTGHGAPVERVRFHPTEPYLLCTAADDRTVRLWDVRSAGTSRCVGRIDTLAGGTRYGSCVASVEWHPGISSSPSGGGGGGTLRYLAVSEKDDSVHVYDARRLSSAGSSSGRGRSSPGPGAPSAKPVRSFRLKPDILQEALFSPSGTHIVAATKSGTDGMGTLRIWRWDQSQSSSSSSQQQQHRTFVGHTGPIYTLRFSPDGTRLATGGNDALVGLWDVASMVCTSTIDRRSKFVRSVSYSHDSRLVASCSEEAGIDVADSSTGERVGVVGLMSKEQLRVRERMGMGNLGGGADEIAFHPKAYVLACARGYDGSSSSVMSGHGTPPVAQVPQVTVARLAVGAA